MSLSSLTNNLSILPSKPKTIPFVKYNGNQEERRVTLHGDATYNRFLNEYYFPGDLSGYASIDGELFSDSKMSMSFMYKSGGEQPLIETDNENMARNTILYIGQSSQSPFNQNAHNANDLAMYIENKKNDNTVPPKVKYFVLYREQPGDNFTYGQAYYWRWNWAFQIFGVELNINGTDVLAGLESSNIAVSTDLSIENITFVDENTVTSSSGKLNSTWTHDSSLISDSNKDVDKLVDGNNSTFLQAILADDYHNTPYHLIFTLDQEYELANLTSVNINNRSQDAIEGLRVMLFDASFNFSGYVPRIVTGIGSHTYSWSLSDMTTIAQGTTTIEPSGASIFYKETANSITDLSSSIFDNSSNYTHIVLTMNEDLTLTETDGFKMYVNGVLEKTGNLSENNGALVTKVERPLQLLGKGPLADSSESSAFKGYMKNIRFYDKILSPSEISTIHTNMITNEYVDNTNFVSQPIPDIVISSDDISSGEYTGSAIPFTITTTSDISINISASDINVVNGTISNFTDISGINWTFDFTPTTLNEESTLFIPENSLFNNSINNKHALTFQF